MPEIVIREAHGASDIAAVRRLMRDYGEFLANNPSGAASICLADYDQELARLPEGYDSILLAEVDGSPAGCVGLREIAMQGRSGEIKRLWVGGSFRGLRLGRLLLEHALSWAADRGLGWMYLDTVPEAMPEANRLYASLGFVPVERYNQNPVAGVTFFAKRIE